MATTDWKWRLMLFIREVDKTPENRAAFAQIYIDGESGETLENERKAFSHVAKFSSSGDLPAQAFGIETAVKGTMRSDMEEFIEGLTGAFYVVVANIALPQYAQNELIATNFDITPSGQIIYWDDVVQYVYDEFGQQVIVEDIEEL